MICIRPLTAEDTKCALMQFHQWLVVKASQDSVLPYL
jgi:hypothetical protein